MFFFRKLLLISNNKKEINMVNPDKKNLLISSPKPIAIPIRGTYFLLSSPRVLVNPTTALYIPEWYETWNPGKCHEY